MSVFFQHLGSIFSENVRTIVTYIRKEYEYIISRIAVGLLCINPFVGLAVAYRNTFGLAILVCCIVFVIAIVLALITTIAKEKRLSGVNRKRLTHIDKNGDISIKNEDIYEAIRFLYEVENELGVK